MLLTQMVDLKAKIEITFGVTGAMIKGQGH